MLIYVLLGKYTALMAACNCPSSCSSPERVLAVVKQLINKGANINAVTRRRMTALMYACSSGNLEVVKLLLPLSNKFATDNQGWNVSFKIFLQSLFPYQTFLGIILGSKWQ